MCESPAMTMEAVDVTSGATRRSVKGSKNSPGAMVYNERDLIFFGI